MSKKIKEYVSDNTELFTKHVLKRFGSIEKFRDFCIAQNHPDVKRVGEYTKEELASLPKTVLEAVQFERNAKNCLTSRAMQTQQELYRRSQEGDFEEKEVKYYKLSPEEFLKFKKSLA